MLLMRVTKVIRNKINCADFCSWSFEKQNQFSSFPQKFNLEIIKKINEIELDTKVPGFFFIPFLLRRIFEIKI